MALKIKLDVDVSKLTFEKLQEVIKGDDLGKYAALQWLRLYHKYMPQGATGQLATNVKIEPWKIIHMAPYAHYQYEGVVYAPNYPIRQNGVIVGWYSPPKKNKTDRTLKYRNPMASRHWDEAAIPTQKQYLISAVQNYIIDKAQ